MHVGGVLDRDSLPDIRCPSQSWREHAQAGAAFRQNLETMPMRLLHRGEDARHEGFRDRIVEQITETVHEHAPGLPPMKRLLKSILMLYDRNRTSNESATGDPERRRAFDVAMRAARRHLRAASDRIPCRVRPLNTGFCAHERLLRIVPRRPRRQEFYRLQSSTVA